MSFIWLMFIYRILPCRADEINHPNGHGKYATSDDETCHTRFPLSNFPPHAV
jgi:hypothetical protein